MSNKKFIDCGAHTGGSVRHFCRTRPDWQEYNIYSFEPDPQHWKRWPVSIPITQVNGVTANFKDFNIIKKAVWIEDCIKDFYTTEANFRPEGGSTLNRDKDHHNKRKYESSGQYKFETLAIECIDLNTYIREHFYKDDYIVLKLDIEGAEYDIVPDLLKHKTFEYINEFYIEWHNWRAKRCFRPANVHRYKSPEDLEFERQILQDYGLECKFWDCIYV